MYFQKPPLIAHAGAVKPVVNCLNSGPSFNLHPYFVNADTRALMSLHIYKGLPWQLCFVISTKITCPAYMMSEIFRGSYLAIKYN